MRRGDRQSWRKRARPALLAAALCACLPGVAHADGLSLSADSGLRFGSFVVPASGWRAVDAGGAVSGSGIFPAGSDPVGPAQFTVSYDRGSASTGSASIVVQLVLPGSATQVSGGVSGTLSGFVTDLPGLPTLLPGQATIFVIGNCTTRVCSQTFRVGARIDVTRSSGGARLTIPLPLAATVLAVL